VNSEPLLTDDESPQNTRLRVLLTCLGVLTVLVLFVWWPGCRQYPRVTSKESLRLMKLLYTACNTRDPVRLATVEQGVEKSTREGKLTETEQNAFRYILDLARSSHWEQAEKASLRFAQDQVR
jgi:hypothetical protein